MDITQLKLLASRIRALLTESNHTIGHNQSLDLSAALPGLRNWPEVVAFPDHVAACRLDEAAASRLAHRLRRKFEFEVDVAQLLKTLQPDGTSDRPRVPQVWPGGPRPGVYVTTDPGAIEALLDRYEEATDGGVVYAENAGNDRATSIDLGEHGLWSGGLDVVPSGTLLVLGPLRFDQGSWSDSANRVGMGSLHARESGHRVAVLVDTPTPESVCEDVALMLRNLDPVASEGEAELVGVVDATGGLVERRPFARAWPSHPLPAATASYDTVPPTALELLRTGLSKKRSGIVLVGSNLLDDTWWAADLVAAALGLTEHVGPAARVLPRRRSTPAKDFMVPEPMRSLPYLPSVESAYAQGFRRIVVDLTYTRKEVLTEHAGDVLLIAGEWGSDVQSLYSRAWAASGAEHKLLPLIAAILGVKHLRIRSGFVSVGDVYIAGTERRHGTATTVRDDDRFKMLDECRSLRWEDGLEQLMTSKSVSLSSLRKNAGRDYEMKEFLASRATPARARVRAGGA